MMPLSSYCELRFHEVLGQHLDIEAVYFDLHMFPKYMVYLRTDFVECGGMHIGYGVILTAAHCVFHYSRMEYPEKFEILYHYYPESRAYSSHTNIHVFQSYAKNKIIVPDEYRLRGDRYADIALIFSNAGRYQPFAASATLASDKQVIYNALSQDVSLYGFGYTKSRNFGNSQKMSRSISFLRKARLQRFSVFQLFTLAISIDLNSRFVFFVPQLESDYLSQKSELCQGDSGGAILASDDGTDVVIGVIRANYYLKHQRKASQSDTGCGHVGDAVSVYRWYEWIENMVSIEL